MKGIKVMGVNLHDDNGDSRQENLWQISSYFCCIGWHSVSLRKVSNIGGKSVYDVYICNKCVGYVPASRIEAIEPNDVVAFVQRHQGKSMDDDKYTVTLFSREKPSLGENALIKNFCRTVGYDTPVQDKRAYAAFWAKISDSKYAPNLAVLKT